MLTIKNKKIIFKKGIPNKNRFILAIFLLKFPLAFVPIKWIVRKYLKYCKNVDFYPGFACLYGNIHAKNVFLGDTVFFDYAPVYIGENSKLSYNNLVITSKHKIDDFSTIEAEPVHIGKNVWITSRCTILGGIRIGDNSTIGAGSVVTQNIPANCLAAGNPARVIKKIKRKENA